MPKFKKGQYLCRVTFFIPSPDGKGFPTGARGCEPKSRRNRLHCMKTIPSAVLRPLFLFSILLLSLLGCRKDTLIPIDTDNKTTSSTQNYPISVEEALTFFSNIDLTSSQSFGNASHAFINLDPVWAQAVVSHSQSGKEILVVPLADTSIRSLNNGRADAKLLFSKPSPDSISAQILLYEADSTYFASCAGTIEFATFSGVFALFDLGYNFQNAVYVESGAPVALLDSFRIQEYGGAVDRYDCEAVFDIYVLCDPPHAPVFTNNSSGDCYAAMWISPAICDEGGGGGSGGGGTGGGGGGTGGGSGGSGGSGGGSSGGSGGGGSTNPPAGPTYWDVFSGEIPVGAFTGALPPGFDLQLFQQLVDIINAHHFSVDQVKWLMSHTDLIPIIWNASGPNQIGEEFSMVVPVLNFVIENKLDGDQYEYLIYHSSVFQTLNIFLLQHPNDSKANQLVKDLLVFTQNLTGLTLVELNFLYENIDGIEVADDERLNPPITSTRLICANILNFALRTDEVTGFQYSGILLTDNYFGFNLPGGNPNAPEIFLLEEMRMSVYANSANNTCLSSSPTFAANAINLAVNQTQQLANSPPPPGQSPANIISALKVNFLLYLDNAFTNQIRSCNTNYSGSYYLHGLADNWDQLPIVNCDFNIITCP